eukprot:comp9683_c0_seq1/m.4673 comp9683_c0_seq1/g.4673  ORF comp9683_c0_seq1/g.4673 comp9683_c0_seq1/m.4673 type:complete len:103 (-) comp9683_c0_seq1:606-914(-)
MSVQANVFLMSGSVMARRQPGVLSVYGARTLHTSKNVGNQRNDATDVNLQVSDKVETDTPRAVAKEQPRVARREEERPRQRTPAYMQTSYFATEQVLFGNDF